MKYLGFNRLFTVVITSFFLIACGNKVVDHRDIISLNGEWEITETNNAEKIPQEYNQTVPVPGLIDMAQPNAFDSIGYATSYKRYFWYKKTFELNENIPETAILKVYKAKYTMAVFVNGEFAGDYAYNFTPGLFDIKPLLNAGESNEVIIRISTYDNCADSVQAGHDFEKLRYIPGIYDNVELILSGSQFIENVQLVPNIENKSVRVVSRIRNFSVNNSLTYQIIDYKTGEVVAKGIADTTDFIVPIPDCQLWTPENPQLYTVKLHTESDSYKTRFGMREFKLDHKTGQAYLNGKPYFMRGTNVCILRFFEDPSRNTLPWDKGWVKKLHRKFKTMHWNSIRYCIGFPPELWYEIADEEGFLIHDEYPIWYLTEEHMKKIKPDFTALPNEYKDWMEERWNHACVVIWDAQNETATPETGKAILQVRRLDLSNRPWDNGWGAPVNIDDAQETHPYLYYGLHTKDAVLPPDLIKYALDTIRIPGNGPSQHSPDPSGELYKTPIIINEYAWLWLNRDGSPTQLTHRLYPRAFGETTTEERYEIYARHLSMKTEYWRAHRKCAGILHFCGLGYSRPEEPKGQTSDNFIDIKNLVFEPTFEKYMHDAFSPVALMIDYWDNKVSTGDTLNVPLIALNDTYEDWTGDITISLVNEDTAYLIGSKEIEITALDTIHYSYPLVLNYDQGKYQLKANLVYNNDNVSSIRDVEIIE